jgi:hypothetical protein
MKVKTWQKVLLVLVIIAAVTLAFMYRRSMYESPEQVMSSSSNVQPVMETSNVQPVMETSNVQPVMETSNVQPVMETSNVQPVMEMSYEPSNIYSGRSGVGMTTARAYDIASAQWDETKNVDEDLVRTIESKETEETPVVSKSMYTELS